MFHSFPICYQSFLFSHRYILGLKRQTKKKKTCNIYVTKEKSDCGQSNDGQLPGFLKITINGIIAAYLYGCVTFSVGFSILYGEPSNPNTVQMSRNH